MDDESNRNQHKTLFDTQKDHGERIKELEMKHAHMLEKISIFGIVAWTLLRETGVLDKFFN